MGILFNDKVSLRPIEKGDLLFLNKWKNDESVYQYLGGGFLPVSSSIQETWLPSLMDTTGSDKRFIIIENDKKQPVGMVGLYNINWIHRTCELGIFIGEVEQQGKGFASSAYVLIEKYALKFLNLRKIKAMVVKSNDSAVAMYNKLKFRQSGCLLNERFINGEYCDLLIMEKFLEKE